MLLESNRPLDKERHERPIKTILLDCSSPIRYTLAAHTHEIPLDFIEFDYVHREEKQTARDVRVFKLQITYHRIFVRQINIFPNVIFLFTKNSK